MNRTEARIGVRVRTRRSFVSVPQGTEGVIDEDYGTGVMIAWDFHDHPLPPGYRVYDGRPAVASDRLRDGFDKATELHYLEVVR